MNRLTVPIIGMLMTLVTLGFAQGERASAQPTTYRVAPTVVMVPAALPGYHCGKTWNSGQVTRYGPGLDNRFTHRWSIKVLARFYICRRPAHRTYSISTDTRGSYNRNGTSMDCAWWSPRNPLIEARFNSHQYDRWGHQFNPPEFQVPCRTRTWNTRWQKHPGAKRMYWRDGRAPTVHTWYRLEFRIPGSFEPSGTITFAMRRHR